MRDVWIGFVHVTPGTSTGVLSAGAKGAYTNAVAVADSLSDFEVKIRKRIEEYGLKLVSFEDAEIFDERTEKHEISNELRNIAESLEASDEVRFDAFYNYFSDDELQ